MSRFSRKRKYNRPSKLNYKRKRRATYRKRRKFSRPSVSRIRPLVLPDKMMVKLRYEDFSYNTSAVLSQPLDIIYNANGLYDPYYALGGHQPAGFDQWMIMYNQYEVSACKIVITVNNLLSSTLRCCLIPSTMVGLAVTNPAIFEQSGVRTRIVGNALGSSKTVLKHYATTKKMWQVKDVSDDENFRAFSGSNPLSLWYWHILLDQQPGPGSIPSYGFTIDVKLTFYCTFMQKKTTLQDLP